MKIHIYITEVEDSVELLDIIKKLYKVRESIYIAATPDFVIDVKTEIKA